MLRAVAAAAILCLLAVTRIDATPPYCGGEEDRVYPGSEGRLAVDLLRVDEAEVRIDGLLDEEIWQRASLLNQFTQMEPAEGIPATEKTEVLVFYTPSALYVGIRAYAADPSRIRATLADRDKILRDDHVQLILDTFNDRRRAYALYVNPLGIQQDGIYNEGAGRRRGDGVDFNPNFIFDSRGRIGDDGYTVELRIPFKSLKFQASQVQTWGINVVRRIAATGAEETWAPISRSNPSRLAQSGQLLDIRDLRPGRLLEINPVATGRRDGVAEEGRFTRDSFQPDFGMNVKFGVTPNLTLDGTVNPDFSQVEADAGQITVNERFAVFFPEKRPFFLEGADLFATPEQLVYTRAIVDPIAGAKLTGKMGSFNVGYLGALDESPLANPGFAPDPSRATFNIARVQRDVGTNSSLGALFTDREAAGQFNRVAGLDGRVRFSQIYTWEFQVANSWTRRWLRATQGSDTAWVDGQPVSVAAETSSGHLVQTSIDRTGRNWGFRLQAKDIPSDFRAQSGFVRRTGVTDFFLFARYTWFGQPGGLLESTGPWLMSNRIFGGRDFWHGEAAQEGMARLRWNFNLRGNNRVVLGASRQFYVLDPARYQGYQIVDAQGRTRTGAELIELHPEMRGLDGVSIEMNSSYFKTLSLESEIGTEETPIFAEGSLGRQWSTRGEMQLRPTDALRLETELRYARIYRQADGSLYSQAMVPRAKAEYQVNRAIFVRAVGQYSIENVDVLRAPDGSPYLHNGAPFRLRGGSRWHPGELQTNPLRLDLLFSYQPSPGTVLFLGYGREMRDQEAYRLASLEPQRDGLFLKLSYLFRT